MTEGKRLAGRKIVITGAASGIGKAVAELFMSEGASVGLLDLDATGAAATLGENSGASAGVIFIARVLGVCLC